MIVLPKGTTEHLILDVSDALHELTDLAGTNALFDVREKGASNWIAQNIAATVVGMRMYCLINTASYNIARHELFAHFSIPPENPRIGPFEFDVDYA